MSRLKATRRSIFHLLVLVTICLAVAGGSSSGIRAQEAAPPKTPPVVGTIKEVTADFLTLTPDSGSELKVALAPDTKVLRVPPGSKDLKEATPLQLSDLQTGDRILVRGKPGAAPQTFSAVAVIVMKQGDIAQQRAKQREDWQRRGIGGLVKSVDAASGTVTIGTMTPSGPKDVAVHTTQASVFRRYAPGSVKFDDAKPSTLAEIHAGDQLRARGTKNADGTGFAADELVTGAFRNIAGTIVAVDEGAGTVTVNDLAAKKNVEVKIAADSQLRKLPAQAAQMIAMRLKGGAAAGTASGAPAGANAGPGAGAPGAGRGGDMQQMLSRLPASALGDFQKGDTVMVVATEGTNGGAPTLITMLGGVEPLLQASPGQASSLLTPWSLSGGGGGDAGTP